MALPGNQGGAAWQGKPRLVFAIPLTLIKRIRMMTDETASDIFADMSTTTMLHSGRFPPMG